MGGIAMKSLAVVERCFVAFATDSLVQHSTAGLFHRVAAETVRAAPVGGTKYTKYHGNDPFLANIHVHEKVMNVHVSHATCHVHVLAFPKCTLCLFGLRVLRNPPGWPLDSVFMMK